MHGSAGWGTRCGRSRTFGTGALQLAGSADPTASLEALVAALGTSVASADGHGLHVYTFGGARRAAAWLSAMSRPRAAP